MNHLPLARGNVKGEKQNSGMKSNPVQGNSALRAAKEVAFVTSRF
jgi:hypothetical protein